MFEPTHPWLRRLASATLLVLGLAGCGGGGVDTGGTGASSGYASGPITGFGSVIVGGVRFDDSTAEVQDLDGVRRTREELRLGMTVEVDSGAIVADAAGSSATARRIRFESELQGLVGVVNLVDSSFTLLGQRVTVDATTVFDERLAGGLAGLATGQAVAVYAVFDAAAQRYRATRVEPAGLALLRLRGPVAAVDPVAQTLRVGSVTYGYAGASNIPADLNAGQYVRLRLELELQPLRWTVRAFATALQPLPDSDGIKIEGLVTTLVSANLFTVSGRLVDASGVVPAGLALGVRVEVEGQIRNGAIRATRVTVKSDDEVRERGFEIAGLIASTNPAQGPVSSFVLRGNTITTGRADLRYDNGTAADLQPGRLVEVRAQLSADRRTLEATRIRFR